MRNILNPFYVTGFIDAEGCFHVSIINKGRSYSSIAVQQSSTQNLTIDPWFVTGFTDAEGCFSLSIIRNNKLKSGWGVRARFQIVLHQKDKALLEYIQRFFCIKGSLFTKDRANLIELQVQSVKDLKVIINHFDKYGLITQKRADYELWKQAVELMEEKEHLTEEGLAKIVALKASMNTGLSDELKAAFPNITSVSRPSVGVAKIQDPQWLAGFTTGEGCFYINVMNSSNHRLGFQVVLGFQITQHSRDITLMESLIKFWDCGSCSQPLDYNHVDFRVRNFSDVIEKIIPFFQKYPVLGVKAKDFVDWCKVAEMMQNKAHLTAPGLEEIRKIKAGMNKGR